MTTSPPTTGRAILYARKSSKQDRSEEQSASVEDQFKAGRDYATFRGWTVIAEEEDDGRSGLVGRSKRPGLDAALHQLESGQADKLVMLWKSRLSRDELDRALILRDLEQWGVEWHAVADGGLVDRSTYAGYIKDKADEMVDTGFSVRVRENWRRVHARRLEDGLPKTGNARFGYWRELARDRRSGREYPSGPFMVDESLREVVRQLYIRYAEGKTGFTPLVTWLNERGITTTQGNPWTVRALSRYLDTGFAAGYISKESEHRELKGSHEPLITEEEWASYRRQRERVRDVVPRKRQAPRWYLSSVARCGLCGGPLYVETYNRPNGQVACTNHRANRSACSGRMRMKRLDLEREVTWWLAGHLEELAALVPSRDREREIAQKQLEEAQAALDRLAAALGRLARAWALGEIDHDGYRGAQNELLAEQRAAEKEVGAAREAFKELEPVDADVLERLERAPEATPAEFGEQLRKLLKRVEVHKDRVVLVPVVGEAAIHLRDTRSLVCVIEGCESETYLRELCRPHYNADLRARRSDEVGECTESGCTRPVKAKGLCNRHYQRHRRFVAAESKD